MTILCLLVNKIRIYIHTYLLTYILTYLHTYIPTYIHTYIHPYRHTYIQTCRHNIHTYSSLVNKMERYIHMLWRLSSVKQNFFCQKLVRLITSNSLPRILQCTIEAHVTQVRNSWSRTTTMKWHNSHRHSQSTQTN